MRIMITHKFDGLQIEAVQALPDVIVSVENIHKFEILIYVTCCNKKHYELYEMR